MNFISIVIFIFLNEPEAIFVKEKCRRFVFFSNLNISKEIVRRVCGRLN